MTNQFWVNNPVILLNKESIFELWPMSNMDSAQKQNAIARLIIVASILGYLLTQNSKIIIAGIMTLIGLAIVNSNSSPKLTSTMLAEGFRSSPDWQSDNLLQEDTINDSTSYDGIEERIINPETLESTLKSNFQPGTKKNPFGNVLLTEILDKPERKSAYPSFNPNVEEEITENVKKLVQFNNPGIKNTDKQIFGDLYENWELDQSNRAFFSTANTKISNDQSAFANWLYDGLKYSAKESTPEGNLQRVKDNLFTSHYNLY